MTITEVKSRTGQSSLTLVRQLDKDTKAPQPWVSHWDNDNRVRVSMHEEVLAIIKDNPEFAGLGLKKETVTPKDGTPYTRYVVITPKNIEATF